MNDAVDPRGLTRRDKPLAASPPVAVWDPFVRLSHWALVGAVTAALLTSLILPPTWITLHIISGTTAAALVVARTVWGFLGPTYARFASFVRSPRVLLGHVRDMLRDKTARHIGHNPLGGAMILALIATIFAIAVTGTVALGGDLKSGPLAFITTFAVGSTAREIHQLLAWGLIGLIVLHIGGVAFESLRSHDNLVLAMVTGRKEASPAAHTEQSRAPHPLLALATAAGLAIVTGATVISLSGKPALGVPTTPIDPLYAQECGACHQPYHPSLLPAAIWSATMDNLGRHFGEDASLDPPEVGRILDYLVANAAETADTRAAHVFRQSDPVDPLRITATPFWRRTHAGIPDAVFASKAVHARSNCAACHADAAAGRFNPDSISIPRDANP